MSDMRTRLAAAVAEIELRKMLDACEKRGTGEPWASNVRALLAGIADVTATLNRLPARPDSTEVYVSGCMACPFDDDIREECRHPDVDDGKGAWSTTPARTEYGGEAWEPDWCPLRKRPALVRLCTKETP